MYLSPLKGWRGSVFACGSRHRCLNGENVMPKIKTNRAAAKRFKKTGKGKFTFAKSHASHILTKKTTKRKRGLRKSQLVKKSDIKELKLLLPNS